MKAKPLYQRWLGLFAVLLLIIPTLIICGGYNKINNNLNYLSTRQKDWEETKVIATPRGQIFARNGEILAGNCKRFKILLELKKAKPISGKVSRISNILGISEEQIINKIANARKRFNLTDESVFPIEIARDITCKQATNIELLRLKGIYLEPYYTRYYPFGDRLAAKLIGFISYSNKKIVLDPTDPTVDLDSDKYSKGMLEQTNDPSVLFQEKQLNFVAENYVVGRDGIEYSIDNHLSGDPGLSTYRGDGKRNPIPGSLNIIKETAPGKDVSLTLDIDIQTILESEVKKIDASYNPKYALIAVMDPKTGEILGSACTPNFDPNKGIKNPQNWYKNPLTQIAIEPGSVFKPIVVASFLEKGWASIDDQYYCGVNLSIENDKIGEAEDSHAANSFLNLDEIITRSSNIGMAQLMMGIGRDSNGGDLSRHVGTKRVHEIAKMWELGEPTGIELPWENPGLVHKGSIKLLNSSVYPYVELATFGFGQGLKVTPIQLLRAYSVFANGGFLVKPKITLSSDSSLQKSTRILSPTVVREMKSMLSHVVVSPHGTGKKADVPEFGVAGKTGTAQVWFNNGYSKDKYISSFIGYFPSNQPKYTMLVMVWYPQGGQVYGGAVAGPSFARVAKRIGYLKHIEPKFCPNSSRSPNKKASSPLAFFTPAARIHPKRITLAAPLFFA